MNMTFQMVHRMKDKLIEEINLNSPDNAAASSAAPANTGTSTLDRTEVDKELGGKKQCCNVSVSFVVNIDARFVRSDLKPYSAWDCFVFGMEKED